MITTQRTEKARTKLILFVKIVSKAVVADQLRSFIQFPSRTCHLRSLEAVKGMIRTSLLNRTQSIVSSQLNQT